MRYLFSLAFALLAITARADVDEQMETGKLVAWIITIAIALILAVAILVYCICSRAEKARQEDKVFARQMSLASQNKKMSMWQWQKKTNEDKSMASDPLAGSEKTSKHPMEVEDI